MRGVPSKKELSKTGVKIFKRSSFMKNIFKVLALGVAATALFACTKETPVEENISQDNVKLVQFTTAPLTKTVFGTPDGTNIPTLWTENHKVALSLNLGSYKTSTTPELSDGGLKARFSAEITSDESGDYNIYAVSPYESVVSVSNSYNSIQITVPTTQTPSSTSPDELAQIVYGKHAAGATFPTSVTMSFDHLTAYGKISFSNLSLAAGESIVSVSLTAAENWAGRYYYYAEDHSPNSAGDIVESSASSTITIITTSAENIWFGCAPVDLGGKKVDVVITTNVGTTYSKSITIPAGKTFESGKVNAFTINMSGIVGVAPVVYKLVKDIAEVTTNSEVIIVASSAELALSTTQNSNNRGTASITKSTDGSGNSIITSPGVDVQVLTIKDGNKGGTLALYTGDGYLCAASSSSNYLRTEATLSDNSSWSVAISTSDGEATMLAQGSNTRNYIRCNTSNNPTIFSCYAEGSSTGVPVLIYKKVGSGDAVAAKTLSSIAITTPPTKTSYNKGDAFEPAGMVVTATYSDETTADVTASVTTDFDSVVASAGNGKAVTVTYYEGYVIKTATFSIDVASLGGSETATFIYSDLHSDVSSGGSKDLDGKSDSVSGITITYKKVSGNNSPKYYDNGKNLRIYATSTMTFTAPAGKKITEIDFSQGTTIWASDKMSGNSGTVSNETKKWTSATGAETIVLTITGSFRFTKIVVTYE